MIVKTMRVFALVEEGGFEPPKRNVTDLQSAPFGHSGTPPYLLLSHTDHGACPVQLYAEAWSWWTDLNPRPADYKSAALPTELHQHNSKFERLTNISFLNLFVNTFSAKMGRKSVYHKKSNGYLLHSPDFP